MQEKLSECLSKLASVLHWHGKHNETNVVILLGRLARASGLEEGATIDDLAKFVEDVEAEVASQEIRQETEAEASGNRF